MAITYPVDVQNTKWAVLQLSTGEVVSRNKSWPVADGSEIPGLDPDFVYLLHVNATPPDYDYRVYTLDSTETVDATANEIRLTYTTVKRPVEELVVAAENVESEQTQRHIVLEREVIETRLMVAALIQFMDGLQLPPKMRQFADRYKSKGVKLWKNRDRLKAIIADIEAGNEPDLDAGWEAPSDAMPIPKTQVLESADKMHLINPYRFDGGGSIYSVNGKEPIAAWIESLDPEPTTSTVATDLVGSNDGTLTNMTPATDRVADTGEGGVRALDFDGANDYVLLPSGYTQNASQVTISSWAKFDSLAFPRFIFTETVSGTISTRYSLAVTTSGELRLAGRANDTDSFTVFAISTGVTITTGSWYHLVGVYDSTTGNHKVFVNGVDVTGSAVGGTTAFDNTSPFRVRMGYNAVSNYMDGLVDDVRIWDQPLDADDVSDLDTAQRGGDAS